MKISRQRDDHRTPVVFTDRVEDIHKPGVIIHCPSYEEHSFVLMERKLVNKYVQFASQRMHASSQTKYPYPQNASVQCYPRSNLENVNLGLMESEGMQEFFAKVIPRLVACWFKYD